jgi:hypothetical protein
VLVPGGDAIRVLQVPVSFGVLLLLSFRSDGKDPTEDLKAEANILAPELTFCEPGRAECRMPLPLGNRWPLGGPEKGEIMCPSRGYAGPARGRGEGYLVIVCTSEGSWIALGFSRR